MIVQIFWVIFLLFIWFKTDAFIQYSKLFRINKISKIDSWELYRLSNTRIAYLEYLSIKHRNFFTKLISCKPCLTFWLVLITCFIFNTIYLFPIIYIISYIVYKIIEKYV